MLQECRVFHIRICKFNQRNGLGNVVKEVTFEVPMAEEMKVGQLEKLLVEYHSSFCQKTNLEWILFISTSLERSYQKVKGICRIHIDHIYSYVKYIRSSSRQSSNFQEKKPSIAVAN